MSKLEHAQIAEFSTNVYDELVRRTGSDKNIWKESV